MVSVTAVGTRVTFGVSVLNVLVLVCEVDGGLVETVRVVLVGASVGRRGLEVDPCEVPSVVPCRVVRVGRTDVAPPGVVGFVEPGGDLGLLVADVKSVSVWLGLEDVARDVDPVERKGTAVVTSGLLPSHVPGSVAGGTVVAVPVEAMAVVLVLAGVMVVVEAVVAILVVEAVALVAMEVAVAVVAVAVVVMAVVAVVAILAVAVEMTVVAVVVVEVAVAGVVGTVAVVLVLVAVAVVVAMVAVVVAVAAVVAVEMAEVAAVVVEVAVAVVVGTVALVLVLVAVVVLVAMVAVVVVAVAAVVAVVVAEAGPLQWLLLQHSTRIL